MWLVLLLKKPILIVFIVLFAYRNLFRVLEIKIVFMTYVHKFIYSELEFHLCLVLRMLFITSGFNIISAFVIVLISMYLHAVCASIWIVFSLNMSLHSHLSSFLGLAFGLVLFILSLTWVISFLLVLFCCYYYSS